MAKKRRPKLDLELLLRVQNYCNSGAYSKWLDATPREVIRRHMEGILISASVKHSPAHRKTSSRRSASANDESEFIAYDFVGFPTDGQAMSMNQTIGNCRYLWNRMLTDRLDYYSVMGKALYNTPADYKDVEGLEWLAFADSLALANVQLRLERTFSDWLSGLCGKPRLKKKHLCRASYTTNVVNGNIRLDTEAGTLTLPKVKGPVSVRCHREIRPGGKLKSVTVSHEPDGSWHFVILMEYPKPEYMIPSWLDDLLSDGDVTGLRHTGLDMSLPDLYVMPDGTLPSYTLKNVLSNGCTADVVVSFEKQYKKYQSRIAKEQHKLSHMVKDSRNYRRECEKIASLHAKAKHARHDFLHQMAVRLAREYDIISIESLDVRAMKKALRFGKSVSDNGWGLFTQYLARACEENGCLLIRVDKWFPSSKTCSHCGYVKKDLKLKERTYICPRCGHVMGRDAQAALNIDREGLRMLLDAAAEADRTKQNRQSAA